MIDTQNNGVQGPDFRSLSDLSKEQQRKELGQAEFLELMTTQLQNQDPFKPMESGDFLSQIAQFSTVEGIGDLNASFSELSDSLVSSQALQASNLVGREVLASTGIAALGEDRSIRGTVQIPADSTDVVVTVYDQAGQVIKRLDLGSLEAGAAEFKWNGNMGGGKFAEPGAYFVSAEATNGGTTEAVETLIASEVRSVTLSNSGGLLLDLAGIGPLDFKDVRQIL